MHVRNHHTDARIHLYVYGGWIKSTVTFAGNMQMKGGEKENITLTHRGKHEK
jgi:hypothetical protein